MKKFLLFSFLLLTFGWIAQAQDRSVTGIVTSSEDGSVIPGVSISIKGSSAGTTTDANGKYRISAASGSTLVFSSIGFQTHEIILGTQSVVDVRLSPKATDLSEAVIVGYGSIKKADITGSIVSVAPKNIENVPFTSVDKALQGQVAGLQSSAASGAPGANQVVRIRGISSINASNDPLWVIDGIPVNSGQGSSLTTTSNLLSTLNPNDIESISVLKDAASQSIYGSRAANGVIIVNTKKGKSGKTRYRFDTEIGQSDIAYQNPRSRPLNASEYFEVTREGLLNAGYSEAVTNSTVSGLGEGNGVDFDWLNAVLRKATQQQYNLSVEGGNDKTTFFVSGGHLRQEGVVINTDYSRTNGNVRLTHKASNKLTINVNMNGGFVNQRTPLGAGAFGNPVLSAFFMLPSRSPYNADGSYNITSLGGLHNTLALAEWDKRRLRQTSLRGNVFAEYAILSNLKFKTSLGADVNLLEEDQYNNPNHGDGASVGGRAFSYYTRYFNWVWTNTLNLQQKLTHSGDLMLNAQLGYESQASRGYFSSLQAQGFLPFLSLSWPASGSTPITSSTTISDYTFVSQFITGDINYKNRYVVSGSFRRDGSSRFSPNNKYGNFWSAGVSWNVDQENFMQNLSFINQFKLRSSYGVNGNAGIGNYDWQAVYSTGYNYNQTTGIAPSSVGNANLTWELNKPFNVGADLSFLGNRINLTAEYYNRKSENLLLSVPLSGTSGFTTATRNIGAMKNEGVELTLNVTPVQFKDFKWVIDFNYSHNTNKITSLPSGSDIISSPFIYRVGESVYTYYMREYAGVDPANGNPLWYSASDHATTTSTYSSAEQTVLSGKSTLPKYFGSFTNTFTYKGISLDFQFYYNAGNYSREVYGSYYLGAGYGGTYNKLARVLDRWQQAGDVTDIPKYVYGGNNNFHSLSTFYIFKGDYIRLRNVQLGYRFPASLISKIGLSSAFIYARGTNLWTIVKDKNLPFDPEQGIPTNTTASALSVFIPKTLTLGLNIGF
ncbi:MAG: TonB-dependent receptor [Siphonobacter sp.]